MFQPYAFLQSRLNPKHSNERGATMAEYCIMVSFIAMVCFVLVAAIGGTLRGFFSSFAGSM